MAYRVSEVNRYLKRLFDGDPILDNIEIIGEISNFKRHSSGVLYFSLKEEGALLKCVVFSGNASRLTIDPENGMEVVCRGNISVFERDGVYQYYISSMRLNGMGPFYEELQRRMNRYEEMGLFADEYKKPIPAFGQKIGVVTAQNMDAIKDIKATVFGKNPYAKIVVYPSLVQGPGAAAEIAEGIRTLDRMGLDVIIIGRGGGSVEELWAFSEDEVVMAVFHAQTPIISAVGHTASFAVANYVADYWATTPTKAGAVATFDYAELMSRLENYENRFDSLMDRAVKDARPDELISRMDSLMEQAIRRKVRLLSEKQKALQNHSPEMMVAGMRKRLSEQNAYMDRILDQKLSSSRRRLAVAAAKLDAGSPLKRLEDGYGYLMNDQAKRIRSVSDVSEGQEMTVYLRDGSLKTLVTERRESHG